MSLGGIISVDLSYTYLSNSKKLRDGVLDNLSLVYFLIISAILIDSMLNFPIARPVNHIFFTVYLVAMLQTSKLILIMRVLKILFISLTLVLILYTNYKAFVSSTIQPFLIADLNEGMVRYSLSDAIKVDVDFPSLSGPTQPIKMLVGRYYRNADSIDTQRDYF